MTIPAPSGPPINPFPKPPMVPAVEKELETPVQPEPEPEESSDNA